MFGLPRDLRYSQNFVKDHKLVQRLVKQSHISDFKIVIEIGAGKGIITKELAKSCKKVVAIEADPNLYTFLKNDLTTHKNIQLLNVDFIDYALPAGEYAVFSNIPYNYTSRIMKKLFMIANPPAKTYLVLQEEAFQRYSGQKKETQISLLLKPFFDMRALHKFRRSDFIPKPRVNSVFVEIVKREVHLPEYRDFIVYGTTQWKSTLKSALIGIFTNGQFKRLSRDSGFDINAKPLDLNFKQWSSLYEYYSKNVAKDKKNVVQGAFFRQERLQRRLKKVYRTRS